MLELEQNVAGLTQNLAECRELLVACESSLGKNDSSSSTAAANANGDYSPPYQAKVRAHQKGRKGHKD